MMVDLAEGTMGADCIHSDSHRPRTAVQWLVEDFPQYQDEQVAPLSDVLHRVTAPQVEELLVSVCCVNCKSFVAVELEECPGLRYFPALVIG
jgi:hypothetical protein